MLLAALGCVAGCHAPFACTMPRMLVAVLWSALLIASQPAAHEVVRCETCALQIARLLCLLSLCACKFLAPEPRRAVAGRRP